MPPKPTPLPPRRTDGRERPEPLRRTRPPQSPPSSLRRKTIHFFLLFVTLVVVINGLIGEKGLMQTVRARRDSRELAASLAHLKQENAVLRDEARRLRDDPATIESLARQHLGLIRPGEILFILRDVKPLHK